MPGKYDILELQRPFIFLLPIHLEVEDTHNCLEPDIDRTMVAFLGHVSENSEPVILGVVVGILMVEFVKQQCATGSHDACKLDDRYVL
jgi:hypothetical protein